MELMVRFVANNMSQSKAKTSFRRAIIQLCRSSGYVPLYNCTTVVKLKMPISLATDVVETYTLHFWKWEKKFL